jgi:hypothetical protein
MGKMEWWAIWQDLHDFLFVLLAWIILESESEFLQDFKKFYDLIIIIYLLLSATIIQAGRGC